MTTATHATPTNSSLIIDPTAVVAQQAYQCRANLGSTNKALHQKKHIAETRINSKNKKSIPTHGDAFCHTDINYDMRDICIRSWKTKFAADVYKSSGKLSFIYKPFVLLFIQQQEPQQQELQQQEPQQLQPLVPLPLEQTCVNGEYE